MAKPGLRKIYRYSEEFKSTAVRLSQLPGVAVQDVAASLDIHPFMLSRWRKEHREGKWVAKHVEIDPETQAELRELRQLRRDHARLQEEHALLKKAIRFSSEQRVKRSPSSTPSGKGTGSK
ncbi:transposase [Luteimonas sp. A478]